MHRSVAFFILVFLVGCVSNSLNDRVGQGDIQLSSRIASKFAEYRSKTPLAFAVTEDGYTSYSYYFCKGPKCEVADYGWRAIKDCEKHSKGQKCYIYALRDKVVWNTSGARQAEINKSETSDIRSLAVLWEGSPTPLAGTIDLKSGEIVFARPNEATCSRVDENRQNRTWKVKCSDGMSAEGDYRGLGEGKGSQGVGIDQDGNYVTFTVGPRIN